MINTLITTKAISRHLFALVHSEWRGLFKGLAMLVAVGLVGATVLEVNKHDWLRIHERTLKTHHHNLIFFHKR